MVALERLINSLKLHLSFLEEPWCEKLTGLTVIFNPLAMLPQLFFAVTATPVQLEGVAVSMFLIFAAIQAAVMARSITARDGKLFLSMFISFFESLIIATIVVARR